MLIDTRAVQIKTMLNLKETPELELPKSLDGEKVNCAREKSLYF